MSSPRQGRKRKLSPVEIADVATRKGLAQLAGGSTTRPPTAKRSKADDDAQQPPPPGGQAAPQGGAAAPAPVLTATPVGDEDEEGICGNFKRVREWAVTNPVRGLIIQKITRSFQVQRRNTDGSWSSLEGATLDDYVSDPASSVHATVRQYWELWEVAANGVVGDGGDDTFGLCSLIPDDTRFVNTTRGSFTMAGEAHFYPTDRPPSDFGFARDAVATAGGLFSRDSDPTGDLAGVAPAGPAVDYSATSTWNSVWDPTPEVATPPDEADGSPHIPEDAWSRIT